jgi:hypothetical protein
MNRFLPVSAQTITSSSIYPDRTPVQSQKGNIWTFVPLEPPKAGLQVNLFDAKDNAVGKGIVLSSTSQLTTFRLTALSGTPAYATVSRAWNPLIADSTVVSTIAFTSSDFCALSVLCRVGQPIGFVRWKLYYSPDGSDSTLIVQGRDTVNPGEVHFSHSGQWAAGQYNLVAISIDQNYASVKATDQCFWSLSAPSPTLSWGYLPDSTSPLNLL